MHKRCSIRRLAPVRDEKRGVDDWLVIDAQSQQVMMQGMAHQHYIAGEQLHEGCLSVLAPV
jgi:hypothetical protein